ncbi:hypothetical protein KP509_09G077900 [Ceratopteris richardii]|nr:hypothetical protein KP509_09G077900 [Ceratopteris richardii]
MSAMPLISLAAETSQSDVITIYHDFMLDEKTIKNIFLCFSLFFMWGCCVFASMKDPFYDSDLYRGDGGDGSGNWMYKKMEDEEMMARQELWREEAARELEERVGELRQVEEAEKEKELV